MKPSAHTDAAQLPTSDKCRESNEKLIQRCVQARNTSSVTCSGHLLQKSLNDWFGNPRSAKKRIINVWHRIMKIKDNLDSSHSVLPQFLKEMTHHVQSMVSPKEALGLTLKTEKQHPCRQTRFQTCKSRQ